MRVKNKKQRLFVEEQEIAPGVTEQKYRCPPHVVWYADMIMHWRCEFCHKIWHERPKNSFLKNEVEITCMTKVRA